jgi:error-prone DNA polymerase
VPQEARLRALARRFGVPLAAANEVLIEALDYPGYFLTMWEIVEFCRANGHPLPGPRLGGQLRGLLLPRHHRGRSGAHGAAVRALHFRERAEPPDIDLDIEHDRREEVIQHVYEKYGRDHAAMVANVVRYRPRSAVRDVGKALGLSETALDRLAKLLSHYASVRPERAGAGGLDPGGRCTNTCFSSPTRSGFPAPPVDPSRRLSARPRAGARSGADRERHHARPHRDPVGQGTMSRTSACSRSTCSGSAALTQLDLCFDLCAAPRRRLSMATIPRRRRSHLRHDLQKRHGGRVPDREPRADGDAAAAAAEKFLRSGDRGQHRPARADHRRHGPSLPAPAPGQGAGRVSAPEPRARAGEDARRAAVPGAGHALAVVAADYTPGEADQLRRDMAAWRRTGRIERTASADHAHAGEGHRRRVRRAGLRADPRLRRIRLPREPRRQLRADRLRDAWLKCHYPAEFACALLNAQPMGFYTPGTIVEDAKRHGLVVRPIDLGVDRRTALWDMRRWRGRETNPCRLPARERPPGFRTLERLRRSGLGLSPDIA